MLLLGMIMYYSFSGKTKIAVRKLPSKIHCFFLAAFAKLGDDWNLEERAILTREENVFLYIRFKKEIC